VSWTVRSSGAFTAWLSAPGLSLHWAHRQLGLRILKFHGVGGVEYPAAAFTAELEYFRRHFSIVPLAWVVKHVREGTAARHEGIALTFDDGLRNNWTVAYPILKRLGIPATFFLCPGLIDSGRWLWNHEASVRLRFLAPAERAEVASGLQSPDAEPDTIVTWMKTLPSAAREVVEDAIRRATPRFEPTPEQGQRYDMMKWDDLDLMDADVVSVGSHTMTHPVLPCLDSAAIAHELRESQRRLAARVGRPVEDFCYPYGAWNPAIANDVRRGYRSAVRSDPGRTGGGDNPYGLRRISATPQLAPFAWRLHRPTARPRVAGSVPESPIAGGASPRVSRRSRAVVGEPERRPVAPIASTRQRLRRRSAEPVEISDQGSSMSVGPAGLRMPRKWTCPRASGKSDVTRS
jgi:peptidoglycan/xylan/chitin deacetylase (PgdA/CDA1 family)